MTEAQEVTAAWMDPHVQQDRAAGATWQFIHLAAGGPWQALCHRPDRGARQVGYAPTLAAAIAAARAQGWDDPHITDYLPGTVKALQAMSRPGVTFTPEQKAHIQAMVDAQQSDP